MEPGYLAAITFLVTSGGGSLAQVLKIKKRQARWRAGEISEAAICEGLHPTRELWSFSAFSFFALSGFTRSYVDLFIICSRIPAIILATITISLMSKHLGGRASSFYAAALGLNAASLAVAGTVLVVGPLGGTVFAHGIDWGLGAVSALLFYGKMTQAVSMFKSGKTGAVSWLREIGLVVKDGSGLWYAATVGVELVWIGITHTLSAIASSSICGVKWWVERRRPPAAPVT